MAETIYPITDPLAVRLWSKKLSVETLKAMKLTPLLGEDENSIIQLKGETQQMAGGSVTFGLDYQLQGPGVVGRETLEGNEEALQDGYDTLALNEIANAVRVPNEGTIDQQRVPFNLRRRANARIQDWYRDRLAFAFFLHVCGYDGNTITHLGRPTFLTSAAYWLFNRPLPPSNDHWIIAGDKTNESDLTSDNIFDLRYIDQMVEMATLANPKIRPVYIDGDPMYVMYLHPSQVTALRTNTDSGQWLDITKFTYMGSRGDNPISKGALGFYNGVILRSDEFVTPGIDNQGNEIINVRRAVLLGAQAAVMAFGRGQSADRFMMVETLFDYKRSLGVSVMSVLGIKKTRFVNKCTGSAIPQDFATIVLSTWAAPATGKLRD